MNLSEIGAAGASSTRPTAPPSRRAISDDDSPIAEAALAGREDVDGGSRRSAEGGSVGLGSSPEQFAAALRSEQARWTQPMTERKRPLE